MNSQAAMATLRGSRSARARRAGAGGAGPAAAGRPGRGRRDRDRRRRYLHRAGAGAGRARARPGARLLALPGRVRPARPVRAARRRAAGQGRGGPAGRRRRAAGLPLRAVQRVAVVHHGGLLGHAAGLDLGRRALLGDTLAFAGAAMIAGYLLLGRVARRRLPVATYATWVYGIAAAALLPACLLAGVSATVVAVVTLIEPVGATLLAWLLFRELPATAFWLGAPLVLAGVWLAATRGGRAGAHPAPGGRPRRGPVGGARRPRPPAVPRP